MSIQGYSESIIKTLDRITSICKDKHAYLRTCCAFVLSELKKDSILDSLTPEERANMLFYPLKIAAETREEAFVALAVDSIQKLLAHGIVEGSFICKSPDVPQPPKKKSFSLFGGSETPPSQTPKNEKEDAVPLVQTIIGIICMNANLPSEEVQLLVVRALLTAVSAARCEVHGVTLLLCIRSACDIFLQAKALPAQTSAKAALSQMIGTVQLKLESEDISIEATDSAEVLCAGDDNDDAKTTGSGDGLETTESKADEGLTFYSVNERDCFLILRSLCKLASKSCDATALDSVELRSKILSLTLLYNLVANMGPNFASRKSCLMAIHKYLCVSLLNNFTSSVPEVTKVSANILLQLLQEHRAKMKSKIAVFFTNVIFPILESSNSSFANRSTVITLLEKFLSDGQAVTDVFVNFDCALNAPNLYSQIVSRITRVLKTSHVTPNWISPAQDTALKLQGAKAISAHITALSKWIHVQDRLAKDQHEQKHGETASPSNGREEVDENSASKQAEFERMLKGKKTFEGVLEVFNKKKAKDGVNLALEVGLIRENTASEIAQFLVTKGLDKVKVGEYLAQNNGFIKDVLKCFLNLNDFSGLEIDEAMRLFLGKFKILGEAEVVDRTMELFAERYCEQNPDAFSSPGTAYILAFSIMMLNTDAHSVHVKSKMTLTEFVRNNRGIDDGKDLPEELMQSIYQRITSKEIKLEGEPTAAPSEHSSPVRGAAPSAGGNAANEESIFISLEKKKQQSYRTETEQLKEKSMMLLSADVDETEFVSASGVEVAAAMWEAAWTPILPALSMPMEELHEEQIIDCCLEGFDSAMSINCYFSLSTERKAFISSLLAFTHLTSFREIQYKNVKSITTLINIASREGNGLEGSWYEILRCISWLDKLHLLSDSQHTKGDILRAADNASRHSISVKAAELKKVELHNAEIIANNVDQVAVDRIFSKSGELEGRAVVDLVEALCKVSAEELQEQPRPRTYSLQKLVEIAEINIGRLRYVWSQMWHHLSKHFINVGLDKQQLVAMFVVDSLRQLAMKFLQRDELGNFNFQRDFLKPFEVIASQTKRPDIHELIIASLGQMVDARAKNIMSGWKIVLNTLARCALDMHRSVVFGAASVLERVSLQQIHLLASSELFTELVNAWAMFGANTVDRSLAIKSIRIIRLFSYFAANGVPVKLIASWTAAERLKRDDDGSNEGERPEVEPLTVDALLQRMPITEGCLPLVRSIECGSNDFKLWLTIFSALSSLSGVSDMATRQSAVEALFDVIESQGAIFNESDWQMIFGGTVYPIYENLLCDLDILEEGATSDNQMAAHQHESELKLLTVAMRATVSLFSKYYRTVESQLKDLVEAFASCARRSDEAVIELGLGMIIYLVQSIDAAGLADSSVWNLVELRLRCISEEMLKAAGDALQRPVGLETIASSIPFIGLKVFCNCCGELLNAVDEVPPAIVCSLTRQLRDIFQMCTRIVSSGAECLVENKEMKERLLCAEEAACEGYLNSVAKLPTEQERSLFYRSAQEMLSRVISWPLESNQSHPRDEESVMMASVAVAVLNTAEDLDDDEFQAFLDACYDSICHLLPLCHPEINRVASAVLLRARKVGLRRR